MRLIECDRCASSQSIDWGVEEPRPARWAQVTTSAWFHGSFLDDRVAELCPTCVKELNEWWNPGLRRSGQPSGDAT